MVAETAEDIRKLNELIDRSVEQAGEFLHNAFEMPDHTLRAEQIIKYFDKIISVVFATVTKNGDPRAAPIGSIFFHGNFYLPSVLSAARVRHIRTNDNVSLVYYLGEDLAVIIHGKAQLIDASHEDFAELIRVSGTNVQNWGKKNEGVFIKVVAEKLFSFARYPDRFQM